MQKQFYGNRTHDLPAGNGPPSKEILWECWVKHFRFSTWTRSSSAWLQSFRNMGLAMTQRCRSIWAPSGSLCLEMSPLLRIFLGHGVDSAFWIMAVLSCASFYSITQIFADTCSSATYWEELLWKHEKTCQISVIRDIRFDSRACNQRELLVAWSSRENVDGWWLMTEGR